MYLPTGALMCEKKNAAQVPTQMLKFSQWPLTSLITSRLKCNLDQNLIKVTTLPDYNMRAPSLTLNIFCWCLKNTQPPATSASFETERCNYPVFVLPDGLYQQWINYLATVMTTRKSQDGLWGPAVSSGLGGRGLGSGNHSVMQTASEIPQRFVVVSGADRYVE